MHWSGTTIDRRASIRLLSGLAVAGISSARAATGRATSVARLRRGLNLSHWFAQSYEGLSDAHFDRFVTDADVKRIAAIGFSHVRLSIEPADLFTTQGRPSLNGSFFNHLTKSLDMITAHGLAVVVDIHPVGASKNALLVPEHATRFVANWAELAKALTGYGLDSLVFEVLNEPDPLKGDAWWTLQGRAIEAIRDVGSRHAIIVNGGAFSGVDDLVGRAPYADPNLVYTVHYYAPLLFTHQATTWSWDVAQRVAGLGWPEMPAQAAIIAAGATSDQAANAFVHDAIANGDFTRAAMIANVDKLARWQAANGSPPIYVGEFGVYTKSAPADARLAWVRAARTEFEARNWGWALWDSSSDFGFYEGTRGDRIDPRMLQALGFTA